MLAPNDRPLRREPMAFTSKLRRRYAIRLMVIAAVCAVLGLWGAWDLWVRIPRQQARAERYQALVTAQGELESAAASGTLAPAQRETYERNAAEIAVLAPGGRVPEAPGRFDRLTQWFFIACLPFAPWYLWRLSRMRRRRYRLEDDGTLVTPEESIPGNRIAGIDMGRWMARSTAEVRLEDDRRIRLDDYVFQDMHLIVGAIAHRFEPDRWRPDARLVGAETRHDADDRPEGDDIVEQERVASAGDE